MNLADFQLINKPQVDDPLRRFAADPVTFPKQGGSTLDFATPRQKSEAQRVARTVQEKVITPAVNAVTDPFYAMTPGTDQRRQDARRRILEKVTAAATDPMMGTFAGVNAKLADKAALAKSLEMKAAGIPDREIWRQTGWTHGFPDGKARFEIDDSAATGRAYQQTPQQAYKSAQEDAFIEGDPIKVSYANSMKPYVGMSKNQLVDEYKRTGGEIVAAAERGDMEAAQSLQEQRGGLNAILDAMGNKNYGPMSSFLKHGELGANYPDVYKLHTRIAPAELGTSRGQYLGAQHGYGEQVYLNEKPTWAQPKETALHELQHAVQAREGFARGGSADALQLEYNNARARLNFLEKEPDYVKASQQTDLLWNKVFSGEIPEEKAVAIEQSLERTYPILKETKSIMKQLNQLGDDTGYNAYKRLAGEVEARLTQRRRELDAAQRRERYPLDDMDVKPEDQIVRFK